MNHGMKGRTKKSQCWRLYTALAMILGYIEILFPVGGLLGASRNKANVLADLVILFVLPQLHLKQRWFQWCAYC